MDLRSSFSEALVKQALADDRVLLLTGDHGYSLFDKFRKECPNQYINAGIAEQNMVGVAAGLAKVGFRPVVYGLSSFIPIRVLEQIKVDVCYEKLPVIFIGDGAGLVYSYLGMTHQCAEDIGVLRPIPNINIFSPADGYEMLACMDLAFSLNAPVYLRMGKSDLGNVHNSIPKLELGKAYPLREADTKAICIIATGSMVKTALEVGSHFTNSSVWSAPLIKPINKNFLVKILRDYRYIFVIEEHSIHGGLGALIGETIVNHKKSLINFLSLGLNENFSYTNGSYEYLIQANELDTSSIISKIEFFIQKIK